MSTRGASNTTRWSNAYWHYAEWLIFLISRSGLLGGHAWLAGLTNHCFHERAGRAYRETHMVRGKPTVTFWAASKTNSAFIRCSAPPSEKSSSVSSHFAWWWLYATKGAALIGWDYLFSATRRQWWWAWSLFPSLFPAAERRQVPEPTVCYGLCAPNLIYPAWKPNAKVILMLCIPIAALVFGR